MKAAREERAKTRLRATRRRSNRGWEQGQQKDDARQQAPGQGRGVGQLGRAEGQGGHGRGIDAAAFPIKGLVFGGAPVQAHGAAHKQEHAHTGQGIAPEQPAPAQIAGHKSGQGRAAGNAGVNGRTAVAQVGGAFAFGRGRGQQGQAAGVEHGPAHALHKTQGQESGHRVHKAEQSAGGGKNAHAPEENAAVAPDIAQAAARQLKYGKPHGVKGPHEAQFARAGVQTEAQRRQYGVNPCHHKGHTKKGSAYGQEQTAMAFLNGTGHGATYPV